MFHVYETLVWQCADMDRKIHLMYFNAGGGHRAAALALQEVITQTYPKWSVSLINLFEVIDSERHYQKMTGFAPEDLYNLRLKKGWTRGLATELKILQAIIRLTHTTLKLKIQKFWKLNSPDLVVSLIPNFNKAMFESLRDLYPNVPFVTVLTDLADYPPNFWIEESQEQFLVCGTDKAVAQARQAGYREQHIIQTSGMILRPAFYQSIKIDTLARRLELGLEAEQPTGLVMFGGHGSSQMLKIAKDLSNRQMIFVCGHNQVLVKKIQALNPSKKHLVIGFTSEVNAIMQLSDYFIGKPGPGSLSEAIQMGLPIITFKSAATMPQERFNTSWVSDHQYGLVITKMRDLPCAVNQLIDSLPLFKSRVSAVNNRAVYEVVEALNKIVG
jgi:UDP-N-acetylglucosamine:LPS N-acetylglucosamine transferase